MKHRNLLNSLLLAVCMSPPALAADDPWYRIEVVFFAYAKTPTSAETWGPYQRSYPESLVAIARGEPRPQNYAQLTELVGHRQLFTQSALETTISAPSPRTFLFESESRFYEETTGTLQRVRESGLGGAENRVQADPDEKIDPSTDASTMDMETARALLAEPRPNPWRQLAEEEKQLHRTAQSLQRSRHYRLLDHMLWTQPISHRNGGKQSLHAAILIETGGRFDDLYELSGTLTFTRSRYLHVNADLTWTAFAPTSVGIPGLAPAELSPQDMKGHEDLVAWEAALGSHAPEGFAHLQVSQRLNKGDVHYVDHPWFGMLIHIEDYEPARTE